MGGEGSGVQRGGRRDRGRGRRSRRRRRGVHLFRFLAASTRVSVTRKRTERKETGKAHRRFCIQIWTSLTFIPHSLAISPLFSASGIGSLWKWDSKTAFSAGEVRRRVVPLVGFLVVVGGAVGSAREEERVEERVEEVVDEVEVDRTSASWETAGVVVVVVVVEGRAASVGAEGAGTVRVMASGAATNEGGLEVVWLSAATTFRVSLLCFEEQDWEKAHAGLRLPRGQ